MDPIFLCFFRDFLCVVTAECFPNTPMLPPKFLQIDILRMSIIVCGQSINFSEN